MPVSSVADASAASSREAQRPRRARCRPRRMIRDFHGTSSTTVRPARPWAITTQRPGDDPAATATAPVAKASSSAARSARLVRRAGGARMARDLLRAGPVVLAVLPGSGPAERATGGSRLHLLGGPRPPPVRQLGDVNQVGRQTVVLVVGAGDELHGHTVGGPVADG